MFTLADKHAFVGDPEKCWLHAGYGYNEESFSWQLYLQSRSKRQHFVDETDEASFGIAVRLHLGARDWQELPQGSMEVPQESLRCAFMFHFGVCMQWEDLVSLDLRFGATCGGQVEVWANGRGAVEAAPNLFPDGEVEFKIHTWVSFRGFAVNVPLNVADPMMYAEARIRALLPRYAFSLPVLRKTSDDGGTVHAIEVLFAPQISRN
jgi:hypothetical protein